MVSKNINSQLQFKAIIIIGPTASGKSALAHYIFNAFGNKVKFDIVNLDAFQIYKEVTAGTAKPTITEQQEFRYHCIDLLSPEASMDANQYAKLMHTKCAEIYQKGHIPICVGGSGLYLRAFLHGLDELPGRDETIRTKIKKMAEDHGWAYCHAELQKVDPVRASELHPNDKTRIERALELFYLLGKPMTAVRSKTSNISEQQTLFPSFLIHLEPPEAQLKERIAARVPLLFSQGWIAEVANLVHNYGNSIKNFNSMRAIGYREILDFITKNGSSDLSIFNSPPPQELLDKITTLTWQYAKRQLTWNAKEKKDAIVTLNTENEYKNIITQIKNWLS